MIRSLLLLALVLCFVADSTFAQESNNYKILTVAFYNLENLFDFEDDPLTRDDDRTPDGKDHWTEEDYRNKVTNMAEVIAKIGTDLAQKPPVLLGVAEVENERVLQDLINEPIIKDYNYDIIHQDSPDRRGIDVGLLYQKEFFIPTASTNHELLIYDSKEPDKRVYTRDQLLISGMLDGEKVHVIVNHWPSRRGGEQRSNYKRMAAAQLNKRIIDSIHADEPYAKIITMGDLNDDPDSPSLKKVLRTKSKRKNVKVKELYNPTERMHNKGIGSLAYGDHWNLFDQLIFSYGFLKKPLDGYFLYQTHIFNPDLLISKSGRYKGYPFRSFSEGQFTGGYSDHFPVYSYLLKAK